MPHHNQPQLPLNSHSPTTPPPEPTTWHCPHCGHHEHQPPNVQAVWHPCPHHGHRPQPLRPT